MDLEEAGRGIWDESHAFQVIENAIKEHLGDRQPTARSIVIAWTDMSPKLSIGQTLDACISLDCDDFLDSLIFDGTELIRSTFMLLERYSLVQETLGPFERTNMFCSEGRKKMEGLGGHCLANGTEEYKKKAGCPMIFITSKTAGWMAEGLSQW